MRYTHGCKPRNPYNMIIQENHAANGAITIISHSDNFIKQVNNSIHTIGH